MCGIIVSAVAFVTAPSRIVIPSKARNLLFRRIASMWPMLSRSAFIMTVTCAVGVGAMTQSQTAHDASPETERYILEVVRNLPADSSLRQQLVNGARGTGIRYAWMDAMHQEGIRRAVVWVNINFDRRGKPKQIRFERVEYFPDYDSKRRVLNFAQLGSIRASGLEQRLADLAVQKAAHGAWVDVPHPRPRPFVGATKVEFFDDEWLPANPPLYCAGEGCLESNGTVSHSNAPKPD